MGDWGSDADSSVRMAVAEAIKLKALDPDHELLKYICWTPAEAAAGGSTPAQDQQTRIEMKNRFWDRQEPWEKTAGVEVTTVVYSGYWQALRQAVIRAQSKQQTT